MRQNLFLNGVAAVGVAPIKSTADANGVIIDMQGFGSLLLIAGIGVAADTIDASNYVVHKVYESDASDMTGETAVPRANILSEIAAGTAGEISLFDNVVHLASSCVHATIFPTKRYVRCKVDVTGTHTNGTPGAIFALKCDPGYRPANT